MVLNPNWSLRSIILGYLTWWWPPDGARFRSIIMYHHPETFVLQVDYYAKNHWQCPDWLPNGVPGKVSHSSRSCWSWGASKTSSTGWPSKMPFFPWVFVQFSGWKTDGFSGQKKIAQNSFDLDVTFLDVWLTGPGAAQVCTTGSCASSSAHLCDSRGNKRHRDLLEEFWR